ncbi:MAG: hypothetical protein ACUVR4_08525 [Anaerolineae bacterium]
MHPLSFERILEITGEGAVGRPHVAQALLEAGHVRSFQDAFDRYIGRSRPAYMAREKFTPAEACALIRRAGGLPVLAHVALVFPVWSWSDVPDREG